MPMQNRMAFLPSRMVVSSSKSIHHTSHNQGTFEHYPTAHTKGLSSKNQHLQLRQALYSLTLPSLTLQRQTGVIEAEARFLQFSYFDPF